MTANPNPVTPLINGQPGGTVGNPFQVAGTVVVDESTLATQTTLAAVLAKLSPDPATQTTLAAILAALQAQRAETLWTDDTLAYFVRVDANGTISWKDISGTTSAAPGTGARPVSGPSAVIDKSSYQATSAATGYSIGDLLDHIIITDPASGVVIGHFWINTTTELKLASSPSSANITPLSPLPTGAATQATLAALLAIFSGSALLGNVGSVGSANLAGNQISVANTATLIAALRAGRNAITVENHGTTDIYLGGSGVTTSTGLLLPGVKGATVTLPFTGALYGIVASGSQTVSYVETY